jgi:hypothetical protein
MNAPSASPRWHAVAAAAALALAGAGATAGEANIDEIVHMALAGAGAVMDMDFDFDFDDESFDFASHEMGSERVVKGAPYCADAVHETVQTLADGNRIVRKQQTRLCRDGEGRTRQEVDRNGRKIIWLRDPVARQGWVLDPQRKTARRLGHFGHAMWFNDSAMGAMQAEQWRDFAEKMREHAKVSAEQARQHAEQAREQGRQMREQAREQAREQGRSVPAPQPVVISRGSPTEVQVLRMNEAVAPIPPVPPVPPVPPAVSWHAQRAAPRGAGVLSPLGSKDIEGVRANGERTTWTIEAGKIGNEKPIQITREVWTSPDLLLTVLTRDADPRRGETIYRLANLKRGEPDATLMKVPSDYEVRGADAASSPRPSPKPRAAPGASVPGKG